MERILAVSYTHLDVYKRQVLHGLARIFVVSVRITFVYVRAYHPFVSVSIRHSERSEEFFSVLLCANLCNLWCPSP